MSSRTLQLASEGHASKSGWDEAALHLHASSRTVPPSRRPPNPNAALSLIHKRFSAQSNEHLAWPLTALAGVDSPRMDVLVLAGELQVEVGCLFCITVIPLRCRLHLPGFPSCHSTLQSISLLPCASLQRSVQKQSPLSCHTQRTAVVWYGGIKLMMDVSSEAERALPIKMQHKTRKQALVHCMEIRPSWVMHSSVTE